MAVNVDNASSSRLPPRENWRIEMRCNPLYTFRRFRRSQSPPSSISLCSLANGAYWIWHRDALFCFGHIRDDHVRITEKEADPHDGEHDVDTRPQTRRFLQRQLLCFQCPLLRALMNKVCLERRYGIYLVTDPCQVVRACLKRIRDL